MTTTMTGGGHTLCSGCKTQPSTTQPDPGEPTDDHSMSSKKSRPKPRPKGQNQDVDVPEQEHKDAEQHDVEDESVDFINIPPMMIC